MTTYQFPLRYKLFSMSQGYDFQLVFRFYHTELFFGPVDSITNNTSKYDFPNLPRSPPEKEVPGF